MNRKMLFKGYAHRELGGPVEEGKWQVGGGGLGELPAWPTGGWSHSWGWTFSAWFPPSASWFQEPGWWCRPWWNLHFCPPGSCVSHFQWGTQHSDMSIPCWWKPNHIWKVEIHINSLGKVTQEADRWPPAGSHRRYHYPSCHLPVSISTSQYKCVRHRKVASDSDHSCNHSEAFRHVHIDSISSSLNPPSTLQPEGAFHRQTWPVALCFAAVNDPHCPQGMISERNE